MNGKRITLCHTGLPAPMVSYPDLAVEDPVIDVLIEALLWVHIDAVSPQVVLDLGATCR